MSRYRCHQCAATFTAWATAQRHADEARHHRIELSLRRELTPTQRKEER